MAFFERDIQKLGFGLMRLPQKDGKIDVEETKKGTTALRSVTGSTAT